MKRQMSVNKFEIDFFEGGHPVWTTIKHDGSEVLRLHHSELVDLEYAISRIREQIRRSLPTNYKDEVDG